MKCAIQGGEGWAAVVRESRRETLKNRLEEGSKLRRRRRSWRRS